MAGEFGVGVPWPAGHGAMVRRMAAIAEQAVAIRACGVLGTLSSELAVRLSVMLRAYSQFHYEAKALDPGQDPDLDLQGLLGRLVWDR
ncbi:hypothetical protein [Actinospica robiniae]|uniref:hypothetical protein n=1 Tax=Actinospica robiniae TaxID=304901 RepID=UPI0005539948|nr:hypothetical protein [Actinospica robiniae]